MDGWVRVYFESTSFIFTNNTYVSTHFLCLSASHRLSFGIFSLHFLFHSTKLSVVKGLLLIVYRYTYRIRLLVHLLACSLSLTVLLLLPSNQNQHILLIFHKTIKMNIFEMNIQIGILWNLKFMIICTSRMANSLSRSFSFYFIILMNLFRKIAKCFLGSWWKYLIRILEPCEREKNSINCTSTKLLISEPAFSDQML